MGIAAAAEISFSPDYGEIQKWCLLPVDIFIDAKGNNVAATDVVIESSLAYVDFVPSKKVFPYFFPPKIKNNAIHIVWFIDNPNTPVTGSGIIGRIFLKQQNPTDTDGVIRLYFAGTGKTYDSNLSILWWVDVLDTLGSGYYRFVDSWSCEYPANSTIAGWFAHMSPEQALNATINDIHHKQLIDKLLSRKTIVSFFGILVLATILFIYFKKWRHHLLSAE